MLVSSRCVGFDFTFEDEENAEILSAHVASVPVDDDEDALGLTVKSVRGVAEREDDEIAILLSHMPELDCCVRPAFAHGIETMASEPTTTDQLASEDVASAPAASSSKIVPVWRNLRPWRAFSWVCPTATASEERDEQTGKINSLIFNHEDPAWNFGKIRRGLGSGTGVQSMRACRAADGALDVQAFSKDEEEIAKLRIICEGANPDAAPHRVAHTINVEHLAEQLGVDPSEAHATFNKTPPYNPAMKNSLETMLYHIAGASMSTPPSDE
tara:strand:- start:2317 stop:3126 length:810 start_codon:yes stop_codon:yes gene_type:complete